ncbi:MAG: hypothetical protein R3E83_07845 [Burkholderiaceae bacterium]
MRHIAISLLLAATVTVAAPGASAQPVARQLVLDLTLEKIIVPDGLVSPGALAVGSTLEGVVTFSATPASIEAREVLQRRVYPGGVSELRLRGTIDARVENSEIILYEDRVSIGVTPYGCEWKESVAPGLPCNDAGQITLQAAGSERAVPFRLAFYAYLLERNPTDQFPATADGAIEIFTNAAIASPVTKMMLGFASDETRHREDFGRSFSPQADWFKLILTVNKVRQAD